MDGFQHLANLGRIQTEEVRAAYLHLLIRLERSGLRSSFVQGHVPAVRLHDRQERYLFAYIPNQNDLLFYVRNPALHAVPRLKVQAETTFEEVQQNNGGETTIRIRDVATAEKLVQWLVPQLPLP